MRRHPKPHPAASAPTIAAIERARLLGYAAEVAPEVAARHGGATPKPGQIERDLWDERVPITALFALWEDVMRAVRRPALTVEFAGRTRFEHLGLFGMAIRTAATAEEAIARTARFQRLFTDSGAIVIERRVDHDWWAWVRPGPRTLGMRLANEVAISEQVVLARQLLPSAPLRVAFAHPAPDDPTAHQRFFRCRVDWGAAEEGVAWPREAFARPLPPVDEAFDRFFFGEASRQLAALQPETVAARARQVIARQLPSADVGLPEVARSLGLSARQLRHALSAERTHLRALVDEVRRDAARALVDGGRHSLTEVAFMLGLSETSALTRAYRRWFGTSPRAARESTAPARRSSRRGQ